MKRMSWQALGLSLFCASSLSYAAPSNGIYNNATGSPVVELINGATSSIDMEIYEMDDPVVIAALRSALARGVIIHIVKEAAPVGASCKVFQSGGTEPNSSDGGATCADQRQLVSDVNQARGAYVPFAAANLCPSSSKGKCLEHGKILVADSSIAMISTGNFNTTNLCDLTYSPGTCNRDYTFVTNDADVAQSLQRVVETDIVGNSYDPDSVLTHSAANELTVGPNSLDPIVALISSAQSSIQIQNQYLEEPTINAALVAAAQRGVTIQVNVASLCAFGKPTASAVKKYTAIFTQFDSAGISTKMFNKNVIVGGQPGYLHAKAIVVDGQRAWMGSENGSTQGMTENREFGIFFDDATEVQGLGTVMSGDFANAGEESWQDSMACAENGR